MATKHKFWKLKKMFKDFIQEKNISNISSCTFYDSFSLYETTGKMLKRTVPKIRALEFEYFYLRCINQLIDLTKWYVLNSIGRQREKACVFSTRKLVIVNSIPWFPYCQPLFIVHMNCNGPMLRP